MPSRTYNLAPDEAGGSRFTCVACGRDLPPGSPFVHVLREPGEDLFQISGIPVMDAVCVYCDPSLPPRPP